MKYSKQQLWERFQKYYTEFPTVGMALDLSRINFADNFFSQMEQRIQSAFLEMDALEAGAIANPDENRMVGHYWLRNPSLAPREEIRREIEETVQRVKDFASIVHSGIIVGKTGTFKNFLLIGIGGSALGPQFLAHALGDVKMDKLRPFYFDNTDPDGMIRVLDTLEGDLGRTLCMVISKSGATKETRNGMLEAKAAYERAGLDFGRHSVAITGSGSILDKYAASQDWLARFPMWDWVGGRTSVTSAVGLLPAALQGFDVELFLAGARSADGLTRSKSIALNPAAQLALAWYAVGNGQGDKSMVVIPYKDQLELLTRYLQQLVMESLGKERDRTGKVVNQGITVFGNKGSTDQHSYIQQLRDGLPDFFVTFVEVLCDNVQAPLMVEQNVTAGDYLNGFLLGTRQALFDNNRESITLTIDNISAFRLGATIAVFERAVGLYASLLNLNAYHQPGVEAGKMAAETILDLERAIIDHVSMRKGSGFTCEEIAAGVGRPDEAEHVLKICHRLSKNTNRNIRVETGANIINNRYSWTGK